MGLADFKNSIVTKDQFSQTFNKFDRSVQSSARGLDKMGGILSGGGLGMLFGGMAGVAGVAAITKAAWELGELGKVAITTERSFNNLMQSVGISSSIIDQYAAAADGTIAKTDLMRMANVALAGTTGELSSEMARLLPTMIEGARAASALNPAMGDASFMLQSLITGVKRGSPMLIDNTGIVLKLGEANEAMAQKLGKSVEALTAQEKSLAILYATADAVPTLVNQVGDAMDETATSSQRLKVSWQELREEIGKGLAGPVTGMQGGLSQSLDSITNALRSDKLAQERADLQLLEDQYAGMIARREGFSATVYRAIFGEAAYANQLRQSALAVEEQRAEVNKLENEAIGLANAEETARWSTMNFGASATVAANNIGVMTFSLRQAKEAAQGLGGALGGLPAEYKAGLNTAFSSVYGMGSAIPAGQADALYSNYTRQYAQLELDKSTITRAEYTRRKADLDASLNDQLASYRKFSSDVGSIATSTSDDLKSKIGSALTPTFDLSGLTGGLLGGLGGDTFDEAYKRLAYQSQAQQAPCRFPPSTPAMTLSIAVTM